MVPAFVVSTAQGALERSRIGAESLNLLERPKPFFGAQVGLKEKCTILALP